MSPGRRLRDPRAEWMLLLTVLIWAVNYPVAKFAIGRINFLTFNGLRFGVAALSLAATFRIFSRWKPIARGDWTRLIQAGLVAQVISQVTFMGGLSLTSAGNAAILLATGPLWTVIISARMHREPIRGKVIAGMICSLIGVSLVIVGGGKSVELGGTAVWGDLICLLAAFCWGAGTNLQKPLVGVYSPFQVNLVMVGFGSIALMALGVAPGMAMEWSHVEWPYYVAAIGSGIVSIAAGGVMWSVGVREIGPSRTGNFGNLIPVVALVISATAFGESIGMMQILGTGMTLVGVWLANN